MYLELTSINEGVGTSDNEQKRQLVQRLVNNDRKYYGKRQLVQRLVNNDSKYYGRKWTSPI
jgi:hypothetical protein